MLWCAFPASAVAQEDSGNAPAHISRVDGQVTLERNGQPDTAPLNLPVVPGDRLRTGDGRVEITLADGSVLAIDRDTSIDFASNDLVRLMDGRVRLNIPAPMRSAAFRIDSPAGSVRVTEAGEYRLTMLHGNPSGSGDAETQIELAVSRGAADLFTDDGSTRVRPGERAYASAGLLPSYTYAFNSASLDDFDRWADGQPDDRAGVSSQYLPPDMREYSTTFDEYGDWQYAQPYGYVWYPRVAAGWRPYYNGRWVSYPRYGWTWIGTDAFAWPTHHYGRWGFASGVWFWIPASRWAPAYVSWAYAPGYVSWCPLGFDNRPVINIGVSVGRRYGSPWSAWTVVSATHFGRGFVPERVVRTTAWAGATHPAFQVRPTAPDVRDIAVPRYVNRGDAIVESSTARPVAPRRDATAGIAAGRSIAVPRAGTDAASTRSSLPIYRGSVTRVPAAPGYRTAPPAAVNAPARTRQTSPMTPQAAPATAPGYAPRYQPDYRPRYEPRQAPGVERVTPRGSAVMRSTPPAGVRPAPAPAGGAAPARGTTAPASAAPAARPAPARGGGAVAVPRRTGGGGGN
jgi:hypothetical protein